MVKNSFQQFIPLFSNGARFKLLLPPHDHAVTRYRQVDDEPPHLARHQVVYAAQWKKDEIKGKIKRF